MVEVCFNKNDFVHLTGINPQSLSDSAFYNNAVIGTLTIGNIKSNQHYNFGTIKKKIQRIIKIEKIIYANTSSNLVLVNLHTNTTDFPYDIESPKDKMVVAFTRYDNHARSLRNNNQTNSDFKKILSLYLVSKKIMINYIKPYIFKRYDGFNTKNF